MLKIVLVGVAILVAIVVLVGVYLVQKEKARCPNCGSIYFMPVEAEPGIWQCRQCPFKGQWSDFDPLAGEEGKDAS